VAYFSQQVGIPGMKLGVAEQETPYVMIPRPGDKLEFGTLSVLFRVQENLANYIEIYTWMRRLGFPKNRSEFRELQTELETYKQASNADRGEYSDATLFALDSDNRPIAEFRIMGCFPTSLTTPIFASDSTNTEYLHANATFEYQEFLPVSTSS
jgi:hypothetical protein